MTNYREILRLQSLGLNNSQIASSSGISRPTVINTLQKAKECGIKWQSVTEMSDAELQKQLSAAESSKPVYKMPDYEYVHREMAKSSVTLSLL